MARTFQPEQGQFQNTGETPRPGQVAIPLGYHAHLELEVIRETVELVEQAYQVMWLWVGWKPETLDLSLSTGMELFPCSFCEIKKETAWRHGDYNGGATALSSNNYLPQDIVVSVVSVAFWTLHEPCDRLSASCLSRKSLNSTSALVHRKQLNEVEYVTVSPLV